MQQHYQQILHIRAKGSRRGRRKPRQIPRVEPAGTGPFPPSAWSSAGAGGPCERWPGCPPRCPRTTGRIWRDSPGESPRYDGPAQWWLVNTQDIEGVKTYLTILGGKLPTELSVFVLEDLRETHVPTRALLEEGSQPWIKLDSLVINKQGERQRETTLSRVSWWTRLMSSRNSRWERFGPEPRLSNIFCHNWSRLQSTMAPSNISFTFSSPDWA